MGIRGQVKVHSSLRSELPFAVTGAECMLNYYNEALYRKEICFGLWFSRCI